VEGDYEWAGAMGQHARAECRGQSEVAHATRIDCPDVAVFTATRQCDCPATRKGPLGTRSDHRWLPHSSTLSATIIHAQSTLTPHYLSTSYSPVWANNAAVPGKHVVRTDRPKALLILPPRRCRSGILPASLPRRALGLRGL
jgi:hypothetical protein